MDRYPEGIVDRFLMTSSISDTQVTSPPIMRKVVFGAVAALIVTGVLLLLSSRNLLPEPPDEWFNDWRTLFFSEQAKGQHKEVAVVLIGEKSLAEYPYRSPVDRLLLADLIKELDDAEPAIIGIDFIFDWPTEPEKDRLLIETIRDAKTKIVLGGLDTRAKLNERAVTFQRNFFQQAGRPVGHLFFSQRLDRLELEDQAVRFIARPSPEPVRWKSFGRLIAEYDGSRPELKTRHIAWLLPPEDGRQDTFATFSIPPHKPQTIDKPFVKGSLLSESVKTALKGKIVLAGGAFIDRDRHLTPLSIIDRKKIHGVMIHAQIVAQIRDGRSLSLLPWWSTGAISIIFFFIGMYIDEKWKFFLRKFNYSLVFIVILAVISTTLFSQFRVILPTTVIFYAWVLGVGSSWFLRKIRLL